MDDSLRVGVDLGGTKIEAVVLRARPAAADPEILARVRVPTERDRGYAHVVEAVARLLADVAREAGLAALPPIGVGMPGGVTLRRADGSRSDVPLVKNSNTTCLNGQPFRRDLEARVGAPVAFDNDANCFALAEATFGAARGAEVVFGVIMGTGVGGGVVVRGRTWSGLHGIAGEWGHVVLEPRDGPPCYCGKRGCIETFLSGPAIERAYAARTGARRPLIEIAKAADGAETIDATLEIFGRALATVIDVLDPSVIVLGGGVSNLAALYERGPAAVARWVFNDELATPIVKHALGDSAGVLGAAMLPRSRPLHGD
ncbi:MAG: ROK family protein [Deltaproteobacteria bacterium]|nr:ROK family protein [Deltaproteobacteria bacterium]